MTYDEGTYLTGPMANMAQSDTIYAVVLVAGASQQITIPAGATKVLFAVSGGNDFYMEFTTAAIAVPTVNNVAGTAPELNPLLRSCSGQTSISLISGAGCVVILSFFK